MKIKEHRNIIKLLAFGIFIAMVSPVFSQNINPEIIDLEQQIYSNEGMIDLTAFVGAEGKLRTRMDSLREQCRKQYDASIYENPNNAWYHDAFLSNFIFAYDRSFYEFQAGERSFFDYNGNLIPNKNSSGNYKINQVLEDGKNEFGGYDLVVIWVTYPRLGIDARNQFDLHKDMPGGLEGLKKVVEQAHEQGVKVFIAYNPWDQKTRNNSLSDAHNLSELAHFIGADGIFLDTMASADTLFTNIIEKLNPDIVYSTEGMPSNIKLLSQLSGGWQQITNNHNPGYYTLRVPAPTTFSKLRWIEPRYSLRGDNRDAQEFAPHLKYCFFHGYGFLVWENVFGWYNPMHAEDRMLLKKCVFVLRQYKDAFKDMYWQPFIKTENKDIYVNKWEDRANNKTVFTVYNYSDNDHSGLLLEIPYQKGIKIYDVWNGTELLPIKDGNQLKVSCSVGSKAIGCIVLQPENTPKPDFFQEPLPSIESQMRERPSISDMKCNTTKRWRTKWAKGNVPGMVRIAGDIFTMHVCHNVHPWMEGACYSDISTRHSHTHPARTYYLNDYYMDKTEVTNAMYKAFLDSSKYIPSNTVNFLKHWEKPIGTADQPWKWHYPEKLENHPVVWVSHDDARAFAEWNGKRLPFEEEWQYAAQGATLNKWPWGNEFDSTRCNGNSSGTVAVGTFPTGASPFGCSDMAGNVWEWTNGVWDDGHTRFTILKGGSYFKTDGSFWYPASGAQPNQVHEKMLLLYPGLDRCANIGFRCVMEVK